MTMHACQGFWQLAIEYLKLIKRLADPTPVDIDSMHNMVHLDIRSHITKVATRLPQADCLHIIAPAYDIRVDW
jgi:hypothetical protein